MDGLSGLKQFQQLAQQVNQQAASIGGDAATTDGTDAAAGAGGSFKDLLMKSLSDVNNIQNDADTALENYVSGKTQNVGDVITASQKANMAFGLLVQIRNKLQDSYDELKNLKV